MDGKLSPDEIDALLKGMDLDNDDKKEQGDGTNRDQGEQPLTSSGSKEEPGDGPRQKQVEQPLTSDEEEKTFEQLAVDGAGSQGTSKYESNPFNFFNHFRENRDYEFENWKYNFENDLKKETAIRFMNSSEENTYMDMNDTLIRVESRLDDYLEAEKRTENPDPKIFQAIEYYRSLQSVLQYQMYSLDPVRLLSSYRWEMPDGTKLYEDDIERNVGDFNRKQVYERESYNIVIEIENLQSELSSPDLDDENRDNLTKQLEFCEKKREYFQENLEALKEKIVIDMTPYLSPRVWPQEMKQQHTDFMATLSQELKQIQDRQIELIALYRAGEIEDPATELSALIRKFYSVQIEKSGPRNLIRKIGLPQGDITEEFEDYKLKEASGEEIFEKMTDKQRYTAKQSVLTIANGGKKPGWIRKKTLHLSQTSIDELIKKYIITGEIDVEELTGKSKEEWTVQIEGEKLAKQMIDEKERKAAEERENQPPRDGEESGDNHGEAGEEENHDEHGGETGENSTGEPKPAEKPEGENDFEAIKARMLENFESLSTDDRVEILVKLYDIHEQGKKVLAMFGQLPREAQLEMYQNLAKEERDVSREK